MRGTPGIYLIRNVITGECYVGQAKDMALRWSKHKYALRKRIHRSKYLQRSWDKHGESAFEFSVLEALSIPPDKRNLTLSEQKWMDALKPAYNSCPAADSWLGNKHTEETKLKISAVKTGRKLGPHSEEHRRKIGDANRGRTRGPVSQETRQKISAANIGKKMSPEARARISLAKKGWVPPPLSEEHKRKLTFAGRSHTDDVKKKLSEDRSGEGNPMFGKSGKDSPIAKPVCCVEDGVEFPTVTAARNWLRSSGFPKASVSNISCCCKGSVKSAYGYVWRYVQSGAGQCHQ